MIHAPCARKQKRLTCLLATNSCDFIIPTFFIIIGELNREIGRMSDSYFFWKPRERVCTVHIHILHTHMMLLHHSSLSGITFDFAFFPPFLWWSFIFSRQARKSSPEALLASFIRLAIRDEKEFLCSTTILLYHYSTYSICYVASGPPPRPPTPPKHVQRIERPSDDKSKERKGKK